jgi:hypothetical protein
MPARSASTSGRARTPLSPRVSLGLRYARVTVTTYDATGAVARSFCFALDLNAPC